MSPCRRVWTTAAGALLLLPFVLGTLGRTLDRLTRQALERSEKPDEDPFLNLIRHADPALNRSVAAAWSQEVSERCGGRAKPFSFNNRSHDCKTLKIGYLSGNFRNHPTADLTLGLGKVVYDYLA